MNDQLGAGNNKVALVKINGGQKVTIKGNGTIEAKKNDVYAVVVSGANSKLVIENGTIAVRIFYRTSMRTFLLSRYSMLTIIYRLRMRQNKKLGQIALTQSIYLIIY